MKRRQFLWTAVLSWTFCILTLLGNQVAGEDIIELTTLSTTAKTETTNSPTKEVAQSTATTANTPAIPSASSEKSHITKESHMTNATSSPTTHSKLISATMNQTTQPSLTQENASQAASNEPNTALTPNIFSTSTLTEKSTVSDSTTTTTTSSSTVKPNLMCVDISKVTSAVICLQLNKSYSCEEFVREKGPSFTELVCEKSKTNCTIQLTKSHVNDKCILLVDHGNKGTQLQDFLEKNKPALQKQAITPHSQEDIGNHYPKSARKTLIALVTSGLLLAFLGLTAYFLMKRRSWSPMGERLGEDPYYTENGSHGNTVASHEQSDLQDKPNLNGGSRENGTGQPASKNGHSNRPHVVADTEL